MKERTYHGPMPGRRMIYGYRDGVVLDLALWSGLLILKRDWWSLRGHCYRWHGYLILGGLFWIEFPHPLGNNPRNSIYYPDTLMNALTWVIRPWLIPGYRPEQRLYRWLKRRWQQWRG